MGRYVPETLSEQEAMLKQIGLEKIDDLYAMVPEEARLEDLHIPSGKSEMEVLEDLSSVADKNKVYQSIYRGAGVYKHYIPAIVSTITSKEEFLTAYTPYQAEISQGVLQSIFEYQTQICELTGLDVSNASVYDGAVAAAEALFMSLERNKDEVLVADTVDPQTLAVMKTYCESRDVKIVMVQNKDHRVDVEDLKAKLNERSAGLYVESPNYYGLIEEIEECTKIVHENKTKMIMGCDPIALAIYKSPGEMDVDIAVGEGQQLGMPMGFGGPYLGFMTCKKELMRKLPGRIVGETTDHDGRRAYVLTLQAREQHIRREKASSNICSNEALCAMTASVYLAAMGPKGMEKVALSCYNNARYLEEKLNELGFKRVDEGEYFNEFLTTSPIDPKVLEEKLSQKKILSGLEVDGKILWCATELNTKEKIDVLADAIKEVL
ncbi:MAG: aminomethyl-transferring glycine dehydrogenase subunit GcvPA [Erysipelotrichaceae bacterium]|nr:aminomethyl-transferring glycine dehydrogenase subunit GcvPA [Erysipelotrichaceae bacterium]MBQ1811303.1 aminomethyl-transferring glycine dehydrogenase subunit GcvPA [Erysipelotrichaceae bacterium]MBQ1910751.1 aminomethyl-transferring glycine dehydrogenase subunit GcvPA [Erysipelotrichaceae bacterium]MBQ2079477.1 aminomethyl-transferring glycine dehydrogenase subunit GcvPA [Erysipelotrichaceae bacterium]